MAQARAIDKLDKLLARFLEPGLAGQVRVASLKDRCLVLVTPKAAIATRLRMDSPHLVKTLRANGLRSVKEIRIRVAPLHRTLENKVKRRELPRAAREALQRFAQDCGDEDLEAIINRGDDEHS